MNPLCNFRLFHIICYASDGRVLDESKFGTASGQLGTASGQLGTASGQLGTASGQFGPMDDNLDEL